MAKKFVFCRTCFRNILNKQLATQLQLMSLNEYNQRKMLKEDEDGVRRKGKRFEFQREKGEGLEALLGSVNTYAS